MTTIGITIGTLIIILAAGVSLVAGFQFSRRWMRHELISVQHQAEQILKEAQ